MTRAAILFSAGLIPFFFSSSHLQGGPRSASGVGTMPIPRAESRNALPARDLQSADAPVYVVYYWRARPGREAEYSAYVRDYAEPIDEEARRAGVFEEVHTYTPFLRTGAPAADWTHMRVFKLKNFAALDEFSSGLTAATDRVFPDPSQRPSSAELRDLVRQEIWRDFR
jgi:hypothetical protein